MAKTTTVFGYTYTDIQSSPADTLGMWNENYAWSDPRNSRPARLPQPPARMAPVDVTKAQVFQSAAVTSSPILMTFALPQKAHEMQEPIMAASAVAHPDEKVPQVMKLLESASKPDAEAVVQWYVDVQVQRYVWPAQKAERIVVIRRMLNCAPQRCLQWCFHHILFHWLC